MRQSSFWKLLDLIESKISKNKTRKRKRGKTPNGEITTAVRLAMALRYFAGGDPLDIALVYKVHPTAIYESVWFVVDAINQTGFHRSL